MCGRLYGSLSWAAGLAGWGGRTAGERSEERARQYSPECTRDYIMASVFSSQLNSFLTQTQVITYLPRHLLFFLPSVDADRNTNHEDEGRKSDAKQE